MDTAECQNDSRTCPLCYTANAGIFHRGSRRIYLRCSLCELVFVPPAYFLPAQAEKAEYDLHENSPDDAGYRRFLSRIFNLMQLRLKPASHGLDFGSGPGPTLSIMFEEAGHRMTPYDPFYAPSSSVLEQRYDFVTASEVVEHLHRPREELDRLWNCLRPGGILGVMTKLALDRQAFSRWHYKDDLTHVCFFSRAPFEWLANTWRADLIFADKDVVLLRRHSEF